MYQPNNSKLMSTTNQHLNFKQFLQYHLTLSFRSNN